MKRKKKTKEREAKKTLVEISDDDDDAADAIKGDDGAGDDSIDWDEVDAANDAFGDEEDDSGMDEGGAVWEVTKGKAGGWRPSKVAKGTSSRF